jgi:flagellin-specific chaperone FliS
VSKVNYTFPLNKKSQKQMFLGNKTKRESQPPPAQGGFDVNSLIKRQNELLVGLKSTIDNQTNNNGGDNMEDVLQIMQQRIAQFQDHGRKKNQLQEVQSQLESINKRYEQVQMKVQHPQNHQSMPNFHQYNNNPMANAGYQNMYPHMGMNYGPVPGNFSTPMGGPNQLPEFKRERAIPDPNTLLSVLNPFRLIIPHQVYDDDLVETTQGSHQSHHHRTSIIQTAPFDPHIFPLASEVAAKE